MVAKSTWIPLMYDIRRDLPVCMGFQSEYQDVVSKTPDENISNLQIMTENDGTLLTRLSLN